MVGAFKLTVALLFIAPEAYAKESIAISPNSYGGPDKRVEKGENVIAISNEDGTWATSRLVTGEEVYQEDCVIKMSQVTKEQPIPTPIGMACTRVRFTLPN